MSRGNKIRKLFFCLAVAFALASSFAVAEDASPTASASPSAAASPSPAPAQAPSDDPLEKPWCAFEHSVRYECGKESYSADSLFEGDNAIDPWEKSYSRVDRCKLWWWAHHVQSWQYQPLVEWAGYAKDALLENLDRNEIYSVLGNAPAPPSPKLNSRALPTARCRRVSGEAEMRLTERLKRLNFAEIPPDLLNDMENACLAFQVETAPWKRIVTSIVGAYLIPIGSQNFVVVARPRFALYNNPENLVAEDEATASGTVLTAIGACPVTKDPRICVEEYLAGDRSQTAGFMGKGSFHMKGVPYRTDVDALYRGGDILEPMDFELEISGDGAVAFFYTPKGGERKKVAMVLRDGQYAIETGEFLCDTNFERGRPLYLRPLALGDRLNRLFHALALYTDSDFPEPERAQSTGLDKGCLAGKNYSNWAAETANAAKHYASHGMPFDTLYRSIALQRSRWAAGAKGIPKSKESLNYGQWRMEALETPVPMQSKQELQAAKFARTGPDGNLSESSISFRLIKIDGKPATEVWYYTKPLAYQQGRPDRKAHVLIRHLRHFNDIYARSVIAKLVTIATTCAPKTKHKKGFLGAMYALFNASPLEQGDEAVSKVFMAATYRELFSRKLSSVSKMEEIDFDAQTMTFPKFLEKYLPLLD